MELDEYQVHALRTDQTAANATAKTIVPLLGLAGEVGELLSEYKKHLRDGAAHRLFTAKVREELGDILWYVATVSSRFGLSLEDVAAGNLSKCADTWATGDIQESVVGRFDETFPPEERFPRKFVINFEEGLEGDIVRVRASCDGRQMGQTLTDNSHEDDGYRFHDVFHLALVAGLGWSPVTRRNLELKRRSDPETDEVEDGGRAIVIEEGISALIFSYALEHDWLRGVARVDHDLLKVVRKMTGHLEVAECSLAEWEATILMAYPVWWELYQSRSGSVEVNLEQRSLRFLET
ncbi:nucleoside triphosphate pyrophosphohydrolase family protein [Gaopeijia maritima]|uniref:nucleoside triphosphate pyrophosphohydrolase family protein n=1 Tax=Gaopeijia maritima TaxID=3119007 RepID=UPI003253D73C